MWSYKEPDTNYKLNIQGEEFTKNWLMNNMDRYFSRKLYKEIPSNYLNKHSIIGQDDADRVYFSQMLPKWVKEQKINLKELRLKEDQRRAVGSMLGLAIGDALGASTEFEQFDKNRNYWIENDFNDLVKCIEKGVLSERHGQIGIWTDDCSMAVAMSDSLLLNSYKFVPKHIRYMFTLWVKHGLGNGGRGHSIGLGGNISLSMSQFMTQQNQYTEEGNLWTSGNGSLMRLAPIPIAYRRDQQQAIKYSAKSSLTTHKGQQAQQCCKLLGLILVRLINRKNQQWKVALDKACSDFKTKSSAVKCLAMSQCQTQIMYKQSCQKWGQFLNNNKSIADRNWNWKDLAFSYSSFRSQRQPGYIGSYCMDALSMALHIIWHKDNFKDSILWAINMGGDCDSVGSIVGQIAGSIYGFNQSVLHLYSQMQDFTSGRYQIFLKGIKLATLRTYQQKNVIDQIQIQQNINQAPKKLQNKIKIQEQPVIRKKSTKNSK